jgi:hypothetical protein
MAVLALAMVVPVLAMVVPVLVRMWMIRVVRLGFVLVRMGVLVLVHVSSLACWGGARNPWRAFEPFDPSPVCSGA